MEESTMYNFVLIFDSFLQSLVLKRKV